MSTFKKIIKYVILLVVFYFFSKFLIYVGLNSTYKDIEVSCQESQQINVEFAQATKVNGRIFGKITNNDEANDVNGKYVEVEIFNSKNELLGKKYLYISGINKNETKKFEVFFKKNSVDHCEVNIVENKDESSEKLFEDVFISEDLKTRVIISMVIYALFFA